MKRLIIDVDNTISFTKNGDYSNAIPDKAIILKLNEYRASGFEIVLYTARNMRTYGGNIGKINAHTLPTLIEWLDKNHVPYDEIITGKPWCGTEGFYVDDMAIRPEEFKELTLDEIHQLLNPGRS